MTIIAQDVYKNNLLQNKNFVNYLAFQNEQLDIHTDEYIKNIISEKNNQNNDVESGFYITDFFLKNNQDNTVVANNSNYKFANLYENKELIEKFEIDKEITSSQPQALNRNISKSVKTDMGVKTVETDNNIGYFFMAFPIIINDHILILLLNCIDLPFKVEFLFQKKNNDSVITSQILINERKIEDYDNIIENGFNELNPTCLDTRIFYVKDKKKTYTDFLKELYNNSFNNFEEIITTKDLGETITFEKLNNYIVAFKNKTDIDKNITILNTQNSDHNISYYQNNSPSDARKLYWINCIENDSKLTSEQKNKISNYYDISFDCRHLKVFSFSNYTSGFYVVNYQPTEIYKEILLQKKLNGGIDLFEVYKDIFKNRIIELEVQQIT